MYRCRTLPRFDDEHWQNNSDLVTEFAALAAEKNCTPSQLAIAWVLAQGVLTIPGMKTRTHLAENVGTLELTLSRAEQKEIQEKIAALTVHGDRHAPAMMKVIDG